MREMRLYGRLTTRVWHTPVSAITILIVRMFLSASGFPNNMGDLSVLDSGLTAAAKEGLPLTVMTLRLEDVYTWERVLDELGKVCLLRTLVTVLLTAKFARTGIEALTALYRLR